jgi:flagellar motor switch protein FliG
MAIKITGPEKAAILLMSIGEENATNVMANMDEREIQTIGNYMSALGDIDQETMDQVTKEFYKEVSMKKTQTL